jgi:hypothetical protein
MGLPAYILTTNSLFVLSAILTRKQKITAKYLQEEGHELFDTDGRTRRS